MRWMYMAVIALFCLAVVIFAIQNLEIVTMSFLGIQIRLPMAVLAVIIYVGGAITGGGLYALMRSTVSGYKAKP